MSLSNDTICNKKTISNFKVTSKIEMYANAPIRSWAMILAL